MALLNVSVSPIIFAFQVHESYEMKLLGALWETKNLLFFNLDPSQDISASAAQMQAFLLYMSAVSSTLLRYSQVEEL